MVTHKTLDEFDKKCIDYDNSDNDRESENEEGIHDMDQDLLKKIFDRMY